jgi:YesN/AraC family two-component response regulator
MNGYTCFVLDDERPPIKALITMIDEISSLQVLGTATRPAKALEKIRELQPDIVFCDINMPGLSGLEMAALLKQLPKKTVVIFTTGTKEHALHGYELGVVDYLVKPVSQKRLIEAIGKALEILQSHEPAQLAKEGAAQQRMMLSVLLLRIYYT